MQTSHTHCKGAKECNSPPNFLYKGKEGIYYNAPSFPAFHFMKGKIWE